MKRIIFVRHGETHWNSEGRIQGHTDIPLSAAGKQQAIEKHNELRRFTIYRTKSSDLKRAVETATILRDHLELDVPHDIHPNLRERCFGSLEGMLISEASEIHKQNNRDGKTDEELWDYKAVDDDETLRQVLERTLASIHQFRSDPHWPEDKALLVVTHGQLMRILLAYLRNGSFRKINSLVNTAHVTVLVDENGKLHEEECIGEVGK